MSTSAIYEVLDKLAENLATALDPTPVFDGFPDTDDPGLSYLVVGVPDPNDESAADSASSQQSWAHANHTARDESGDVFCAAVFTDPNGSAATARAGVKAITAGVEDYLRTNYTLDLAQILWTGYGANTSLQQDLDDSGATAQVTFSISFRARL